MFLYYIWDEGLRAEVAYRKDGGTIYTTDFLKENK